MRSGACSRRPGTSMSVRAPSAPRSSGADTSTCSPTVKRSHRSSRRRRGVARPPQSRVVLGLAGVDRPGVASIASAAEARSAEVGVVGRRHRWSVAHCGTDVDAGLDADRAAATDSKGSAADGRRVLDGTRRDVRGVSAGRRRQRSLARSRRRRRQARSRPRRSASSNGQLGGAVEHECARREVAHAVDVATRHDARRSWPSDGPVGACGRRRRATPDARPGAGRRSRRGGRRRRRAPTASSAGAAGVSGRGVLGRSARRDGQASACAEVAARTVGRRPRSRRRAQSDCVQAARSVRAVASAPTGARTGAVRPRPRHARATVDAPADRAAAGLEGPSGVVDLLHPDEPGPVGRVLELGDRRGAEHRQALPLAQEAPHDRAAPAARRGRRRRSASGGSRPAPERRPAGLVEQRDAAHGQHDDDAAADEGLRHARGDASSRGWCRAPSR